jgi:hypothetical protein
MKTAIITLIMAVTTLYAVPAFTGERVFTQSSGESFKGNIKGDEWTHWIESNKGAVVMYNARTKNYEYATIRIEKGVEILVPSGRKLGIINTNKSLASSQNEVTKEDLARLSRNARKRHPHH